jgi:hypothetical protein
MVGCDQFYFEANILIPAESQHVKNNAPPQEKKALGVVQVLSIISMESFFM